MSAVNPLLLGEFDHPSQSWQTNRLLPEGLSWSAILRVYPHSADALAAAHIQPIEFYIQNRRHTVYNTIRDRDVLKECEGAERRRGTQPRLFLAEQNMAVPEQREYGTEGEGSAPLPTARVAPQARPTIVVEERPREAMPTVSEEAERAWARAHISG